MKNIAKFIIIFLFCLGSCVDSTAPSKRRSGSDSNVTSDGTSGERAPSGSGSGGAAPGNGGIGGDGETIDLESGQAEVRHFIDPFDGTFKTKLTIPKNFTGLLYLSGLNITSLNDKLVQVRFNFGKEMEPIVVSATVGRVHEGGMTPKTDIEVLILNMPDKPFENIRLLYDLYDYNDYRDDSFLETQEPTADPRDPGLYCRGLKLENDPTFQGTPSNTACDEAGERCLYAYAKVFDSGLVDNDGLRLTPSHPQQDVGGSGYNQEDQSEVLKKCLPDNNNVAHFEALMRTSILGGVGLNITGISRITVDSNTYVYNGPYAPNDYGNWEISKQAVVAPISSSNGGSGLFQFSYEIFDSLDPENFADGGFRSHLFPRAIKRSYTTGTEYFGTSADDAFGPKALLSMPSNGDSEYMDGCSARVASVDDYTSENISSCNVTGTIEIITTDSSGNVSVLDSSDELKLQLIRSSLTDFQGQEVLYSSLNTCEGSSMCGVNECCFNERCWSKDIVTQCIEDTTGTGNLGIGQICASDYQCSSLCCQSGVCAPHVNNDGEDPVLCSKSPGQTCVAKEWCRQDNLQECFIVKTGTDTQGNLTCALRCYNVPTSGECRNGICIPPTSKTIPVFDINDPNRCDGAVDPPDL